MHPVKITNGEEILVQAIEQTQTGTDLTFEDTYNDKVLSAKVKGNTVQKSKWVRPRRYLRSRRGQGGICLIKTLPRFCLWNYNAAPSNSPIFLGLRKRNAG